MMQCMHCATEFGGEHMVSCPSYEAPLSQEEIRAVRALLRERGAYCRDGMHRG